MLMWIRLVYPWMKRLGRIKLERCFDKNKRIMITIGKFVAVMMGIALAVVTRTENSKDEAKKLKTCC